MDHNGFYTDLDSLTNIGTNSNSFSDTTCPTLPSLNNFKYQQSTSNIYQQQTIPDLNHSTSTPIHSAKSTSSLPQTQININNCNNNIFFPHDDGLFDATQAAAAGCASTPTNTANTQNNHQKNNFIGYVRKETGPNIVGGGSGDSNITYNINNINTNIVNNINNPTNLVNSSDIFGSNQYHQINKNGETIINFTNNNLNSTASMPADSVTATSQNFYGYQTTNLNTNNNSNNNNISGQGQHTIYESSVQSQTQSSSSSSSSTILDPNHQMGASKSMGASNVINVGGGSNSSGLYHGHSHHQTINNPAYMSSAGNTILSDSHSSIDLFAGYSESLTAAKIINNFENKNPLKYSSVTASNRPTGTYYKGTADYPSSQYPLHPSSVNHLPHTANNFHIYQPQSNGITPKISPNAPLPPPPHGYELYGRIPHQSTRSSVSHYPVQPPFGPPQLDDPLLHNGSRMNYARTTSLHPSYHHTLPHPHPVPPNNYGNYYNNNYNHPTMPPYSTYPAPYGGPTMRNESCSKSTSNYSKAGAMALSPVEHNTFSLPPHASTPSYATKKDYYTENHFYQHPQYSHPESLNSCAKKSTSGHKINSDIYNSSGMNGSSIYAMPHHAQSNGNVMRNTGYPQPIPHPSKHYSATNAYPMPPADSLTSCEYQAYNYRYKNGEIPSKVPKNPHLNAKQFKTYNHFEPPHPPSHISAASHYGPPQYHHNMPPMKHSDKIKISIDLEEQINSSKIPKIRDTTPYGYDLHYQHPAYYPYHRAARNNNVVIDQNDSDKIQNINISLRDFLSTWNEIDDEDETRPQNGTIIEEMNGMEHIERTIMREYNPMFVQKATDNIISTTTDVPTNDKSQLELENGAICEGTEKLYVLETIDVPISELNKYKHLSIINKLPENVVITDKELFTDMEMNREKLYKSEFELEFEACQDHKMTSKVDDVPDIPTVEIKTESDEEAEKFADESRVEKIETAKIKQENPSDLPLLDNENEQHDGKRKKMLKSQKLKKVDVKVPKIKQSILKLKKEKIMKVTKDLKKTRIAKRVRKYSLNQSASSIKTLQSICIDFLNTSVYRNYAREQLSISRKFSKMKVLKDFKKKYNFDSMKKPNPLVNQKSNHSVQINSLREMCGRLLVDKSKLLELDGNEEDIYQTHEEEEEEEKPQEIPSLKELCRDILSDMNVSVVDLFTPPSLVDICENFIYNNRQYFHIEEVSSIPKLQDICKDVLSATNIFINVESNSDGNIYTLNEAIESSEMNADGEPIYIVEENSGNVSELFESDTLNPHEKSEILKKIQRVANIDDDDEIFRAIGALHDDDDNNNSNVYNKNITINGCSEAETVGSDDGLSYMPYLASDELFQSNVQFEEIISVNNSNSDGKIKKIYEILRHKYLNRSDVRQATRTLNRIMRKSLSYQRVHRFRNAQRKERISSLIQQARCALYKLRKLSCDIENTASPLSSSSSSSSSSSNSSTSSSSTSSTTSSSLSSSEHEANEINETIMDIESQIAAKNYNNQPVDAIKECDNYQESPESPPKSFLNGNLNSQEAENFPKLPTIFPSINEYKIERKGSSQSQAKEANVIHNNSLNNVMRKRKMSFDESLLNINKIYRKKSENEDTSSNSHDKHSYRSDRRTPDRRNHSSRNHLYDERYRKRDGNSQRRHRSRSRSRSRQRYGYSNTSGEKSSSRRNYQNSSRHNHYRKDQNNKHSEARRLVLPSYKIYDKDLDVKLKVRPIVRIEREEKVDDMVKKYN